MKTKRLTRREFGIASFAVAMSGCGTTPPPPIDLAVYGDCRQFARIHRRIAGSIAGDLSRSFYHFVGLNVVGTKIEGRVYEPDGDEVPELAFSLCSHA